MFHTPLNAMKVKRLKVFTIPKSEKVRPLGSFWAFEYPSKMILIPEVIQEDRWVSSRSEITVSDYWKADHEVSHIEEMNEEEINGLPEEPSGVN